MIFVRQLFLLRYYCKEIYFSRMELKYKLFTLCFSLIRVKPSKDCGGVDMVLANLMC